MHAYQQTVIMTCYAQNWVAPILPLFAQMEFLERGDTVAHKHAEAATVERTVAVEMVGLICAVSDG